MRDPCKRLFERLLGEPAGSFRARKWAAASKAAILAFAAGLLVGCIQCQPLANVSSEMQWHRDAQY